MKRNTITLNNGKPGCRLALGCEVRVLDAKKALVEYVASDETCDSYREVIRAEGWRFDLFRKNAPFVDSHNYYTIENLVGKVVDFAVRDKKLIETVQWAVDVPDNKLAQIGWKMTEAGYLKAVSVGFWPTKYASKWDSDPSGYYAQLAKDGLQATDPNCPRCYYIEQQQIELSTCIVGANPNALQLARAFSDGVLDKDAINFIGEECSRRTQHIHAGAADEAADAAPATRQRHVEGASAFMRRFETALKKV